MNEKDPRVQITNSQIFLSRIDVDGVSLTSSDKRYLPMLTLGVILFICSVCILVYGFLIRWALHPAWTQMELAIESWPYLLAIPFLLIGYAIIDKETSK